MIQIFSSASGVIAEKYSSNSTQGWIRSNLAFSSRMEKVKLELLFGKYKFEFKNIHRKRLTEFDYSEEKKGSVEKEQELMMTR